MMYSALFVRKLTSRNNGCWACQWTSCTLERLFLQLRFHKASQDPAYWSSHFKRLGLEWRPHEILLHRFWKRNSRSVWLWRKCRNNWWGPSATIYLKLLCKPVSANRTTIFTLAKHGLTGVPDGQTIDTDGNLWVAIFLGSCVIKIDPRKPETLLQTIPIPAKEVTSVAFGGPNLDQLYVTSARFTIHEELPPPVHGATYVVKNTGSKGFPAVNVKL